jgi:integrase/recombinase XerD
MPQKAVLYIRVRTPEGKYRYVKPVYAANERLKPLWALVNGKPERHPEGSYHLRYTRDGRRVWEAVGAEPAQALAKLARREKILEAVSLGIEVVEPEKRQLPRAKRGKLRAAVDEYLGDVSKYKAPRTYEAYRCSLDAFLKSCRKDDPAEVNRRDILDFVDTMTAQDISDRTKFNRVQNVLTFFRRLRLPEIMHPSEMPKYTESLAKVYSKEQLKRFFAACDEDGLVLFQFFLGSGCRDNEVVHACWEDLDFDAGTYSVRKKVEWKFQPKDYEEREIPLSDGLLDLLRGHRQRHPEGRLIFPREDGERDHHMLRYLKKIALVAGLNCGYCVSSKDEQSCREHPVCHEWHLHHFRRTFATMHADAGVKIHEISRWCGHSSLEVTQRYLATTAARSKKARAWANGTFAALIPAITATAETTC